MGPLGSRGSSLKAACATPATRAGRFRTTPAICLMFSPAIGSTVDAGCGTRAVCAPMPRKPTSWYWRVPSAFLAWRPSSPTTGRAERTGVTVVVTGAPSRSTVMLTCRSADARIQPVSSSQLVTALPSKEVMTSLG